MTRIIETELMNDDLSVDAYNLATKNSVLASIFIQELQSNNYSPSNILDIGCGSCNYYDALDKLFPTINIHGIDGSAKMIAKALENIPCQQNISLSTKSIPSDDLPVNYYDLIISSLALHQFANPEYFWQSIKKHGKKGGKFFVFDLLRVEDDQVIDDIIAGTSPIKSAVFEEDFRASLKAAFTQKEIIEQFNSESITALIYTLEPYKNLRLIVIQGTIN